MTIPAEFLFFFNQQVFIHSSMSIMAISAYTFFEGSMHVALIEEILDAFMAAQTEGISIIFHQVPEATCMHIVTGTTLPLFEGKMDITLGKALFQGFMTLIAEIRYLTS
jgi:hypothetical protein